MNAVVADRARAQHPCCVVCGPNNAQGWQLKFARKADGSVSAAVDCAPSYPRKARSKRPRPGCLCPSPGRGKGTSLLRQEN